MIPWSNSDIETYFMIEGHISSYLDTRPIQLTKLNLEMLTMMKSATANVIASAVNYKEMYF